MPDEETDRLLKPLLTSEDQESRTFAQGFRAKLDKRKADARRMLLEVIEHGDDSQRASARALLERLG